MISTLRGVTLLDTFTVAKQREVTLTVTGRINIWLIKLIWLIADSHNNHCKRKQKISKQFKILGIWFEITWNLFHLLINSHSTRANSKTKFTIKSVAHDDDVTTCTCSTHFYWILPGKWPAYNYMLAQKYSRCLYMYVKYISTIYIIFL